MQNDGKKFRKSWFSWAQFVDPRSEKVSDWNRRGQAYGQGGYFAQARSELRGVSLYTVKSEC